MRRTLLIGIILVLAVKGWSQQSPSYSQYTFNKFLINPATAGCEGYTTISLVAREQWLGFKGTPKTHALSIDSRLLRNSFIAKDASVRKKRRLSSRSGRVGWAANIFNDHTGPLDKTGVEGTYAYHLGFQNSQLSFGLSAMFYQFRLNKNKVQLYDDNQWDPLVDDIKGTLYIPDANFGVYYSARNYYGGLSIKQIFQSSIQFGDKGTSKYRFKRHYNLLAGYIYDINDNFTIEPSCLLKIPTSSKVQFELNTKVSYKENYWAGLAYRTGHALIVFFGINFDKYYIGYAFDYNFNSLMNQTFGTHEFMAAVKFGDNARRYKWLNTY
ncbi:MAG: type IX secretion system membrane protein PorP/SprF [Bacteroidales bacterium]|nr:type IX secretion system membrane protein PorP/SprF [Bacteroidales bacterium]